MFKWSMIKLSQSVPSLTNSRYTKQRTLLSALSKKGNDHYQYALISQLKYGNNKKSNANKDDFNVFSLEIVKARIARIPFCVIRWHIITFRQSNLVFFSETLEARVYSIKFILMIKSKHISQVKKMSIFIKHSAKRIYRCIGVPLLQNKRKEKR